MIKYRSAKIFLLLLFSLPGRHIYAQRFDSLLDDLNSKYPQEKIHLHFDRSYYNPGETIWFKAYLTSTSSASPVSKTLYAELIDGKGNILQRKKMPVIQSGAASYFDLLDSVRSNLLYVRAFTSWMLNFDSSLFYLEPVYIINATASKKMQAPVYNVHFFPEGGDLVTGISSRVAFKANDQDGVPITLAGNLSDSKGNKVASFSSVHNGMGYFSFTPLAGEKYKAVWKDKKGLSHETMLAEAKTEGIVLNVENKNNAVTYTLTRPDTAQQAFTSYYVVGQMQQQPVYSAMVNMSIKKTVTVPIVTDSFPDGIMQLTVFNADKIPVAERLLFINHGNYYFLTDLHAVEKNLTRRGYNTLQVDVGGNLLTNLSVAVTDEGLNPALQNKEDNIFSRLLLTSDLKGRVYDPAYYFSGDEDSIKQQLDLVMMTNGWRRFKWEDILAQRLPVLKQLPENYISIQGKIYGLSQSLLTGKDVNLILKTKNDASQFINAPVGKDGQFLVKNLYFFDTAKLYYQLNNDKDRKLTTTASFLFNNSFPKAGLASNSLLSSLFINAYPDTGTIRKNKSAHILLQQQFFEGNKIKSLDVVTVKSREKSAQEKMDEEYTSGFFTGGDAQTFNMENDPFATSSSSVLNYLQGKVAGLQVSPVGEGSVSWRGGTPGIFVNEMPSDISMLQSIPLTDVAMIKVFRPPFFGGTGGGSDGAIAVYTKKGAAKNAMIKGLDFTSIEGYSAFKEFYSPDYEKNITPALNDYRTTLYWNPFLLLDKNKRRIKIPFYNSDNCKKIKVVIEGINEAGQLTREEKIFE